MAQRSARIANRVRIIGGRWRGSQIVFPAQAALRPSPARLRETLFSWLSPWLINAHCLDLFAGSGVLGLEALSRGAVFLDCVDIDRQTCSHLMRQRLRFDIRSGAIHHMHYRHFIGQQQHIYHIVFIDPPFHQGLAVAACRQLAESQLLAAGAIIYVELHRKESLPAIEYWLKIKQKKMGEVLATLWEKQ